MFEHGQSRASVAAMRPALLLLILLGLALAGCGEHFDTDQARLCRQAIPPLNPPEARITITLLPFTKMLFSTRLSAV